MRYTALMSPFERRMIWLPTLAFALVAALGLALYPIEGRFLILLVAFMCFIPLIMAVLLTLYFIHSRRSRIESGGVQSERCNEKPVPRTDLDGFGQEQPFEYDSRNMLWHAYKIRAASCIKIFMNSLTIVIGVIIIGILSGFSSTMMLALDYTAILNLFILLSLFALNFYLDRRILQSESHALEKRSLDQAKFVSWRNVSNDVLWCMAMGLMLSTFILPDRIAFPGALLLFLGIAFVFYKDHIYSKGHCRGSRRKDASKGQKQEG